MLSRRKARKEPNSGDLRAAGPSPAGHVNPRARLGEMLVQEGVVTQGQLDEALKLQKEQGGFLGNTLVSLRYIDQNTLMSFLVKQCKIPHISLLDYSVDEELFNLIPKELCLKHLCIPIDRLGQILTVAMVNPFDADALESVRATCPDLKIKPILCDYNHFDQVARKHISSYESATEEGDDVSAQSFGLSPTSPAKRDVKRSTEERSTAGKEPARASASESDNLAVTSVDASAESDMLAERIEAAVKSALSGAMAPLVRNVESLQQAMESPGQSAPVAVNVEAFPEVSGKTGRHKSADVGVLAVSGVVPQGDDSVRAALLESPLSVAYSFDNFFAGPANATTESLLRNLPKLGLAPVYLSGGIGLGKTHLLLAIGNAFSAANPDVRVRSMTAGMFVRGCGPESSNGGIQAFLETFSKADVLLLDDVHLFANLHDVQAAFVEVFDSLCAAGRPVVIAGSDRSDGSPALNEQLRSRLSGAVAAIVKPPEFETRIDILRHLAGVGSVDVQDEVLSLIAEQIPDDVRRLKGALDKVSAYVRVVGDGALTDDVREMIVHFGTGAVA